MVSKNSYKDWRVILVLVCVVLSVVLMRPQITPNGWTVRITTGFDIAGGVRAVLQPIPLNHSLVSQYIPPVNETAEFENVSGFINMTGEQSPSGDLSTIFSSNTSLSEYSPGVLTEQTLQYVVEILQQRLDFTGLRNVAVRSATAGEGENYIIIEAAGLTSSDIEDFLAKQGRFEAKIGNETIFTGSDVMVDTYRSGVRPDARQGSKDGHSFSIAIQITNRSSMQKFADVTSGLAINYSMLGSGEYLNETLDLFMDGQEVNSLSISANLKGKVVDSASIEGWGSTRKEAELEMSQMQTLLRTGALPVTLDVVSIDRVSPKLGSAFIKNILLAAAATLLAVALIVYIRYRNPNLVFPILANSVCEITMTLGFAALIGWTLDLPSIAGIITAIGTGVDQEIIMIDELRCGETSDEDETGEDGDKKISARHLKARMKRAMFIIIATFGSLFVAMLPLMFLGFGAIRGFAITTIIGASMGFFITRPAFAKILDGLASEGKL